MDGLRFGGYQFQGRGREQGRGQGKGIICRSRGAEDRFIFTGRQSIG